MREEIFRRTEQEGDRPSACAMKVSPMVPNRPRRRRSRWLRWQAPGAPRPLRAMALPSSVVIYCPRLAGGVEHIAAVEPPYVGAVIDAGEHDEGRYGRHAECHGARSSATVGRGSDAGEDTDSRAERNADRRPQQVVGRERHGKSVGEKIECFHFLHPPAFNQPIA